VPFDILSSSLSFETLRGPQILEGSNLGVEDRTFPRLNI